MVDRIQDLIFDPTPGPNIITEQPGLGQDAFLELLVAQLQNQNPLEPINNFDFISQIAQFSTLEQITSLNEALSGFAEFAALGQLASMIGKEATIFDANAGISVTGTITAVTFDGGAPQVIVDGAAYDLGLIVSIGLPAGGGATTP
jgi:flagellar basal-body rod modification protein FlgD